MGEAGVLGVAEARSRGCRMLVYHGGDMVVMIDGGGSRRRLRDAAGWGRGCDVAGEMTLRRKEHGSSGP